ATASTAPASEGARAPIGRVPPAHASVGDGMREATASARAGVFSPREVTAALAPLLLPLGFVLVMWLCRPTEGVLTMDPDEGVNAVPDPRVRRRGGAERDAGAGRAGLAPWAAGRGLAGRMRGGGGRGDHRAGGRVPRRAAARAALAGPADGADVPGQRLARGGA